MGCNPMKKNCPVSVVIERPAPNPDPRRWRLVERRLVERNGRKATLLLVDYPDCSNFEGRKIMVYEGDFTPGPVLDPHFCEWPFHGQSPIARFPPTVRGGAIALRFAELLCEGRQEPA